MAVSTEKLLEAGVHFGHLTRKWNPAMAPYIFMERNGIHILDLHKTVAKIDDAAEDSSTAEDWELRRDTGSSKSLSKHKLKGWPAGVPLISVMAIGHSWTQPPFTPKTISFFFSKYIF